jgi:hypothetical protein
MATPSNASVSGRSLSGIAGSNPAGGKYVCLLWLVCYQVEACGSDWWVVQKSPTECDMSECDREEAVADLECCAISI